MKVVLQRVARAEIITEKAGKAGITGGYLLFVGIAPGDSENTAEKMAKKIAALRVFEDPVGKMNIDIREAGGEILSVSQFTLLADTRKGNRPGFDGAAEPEKAKILWQYFNSMLKSKDIPVKEGVFGAKMKVELVNDGPATFVLEN